MFDFGRDLKDRRLKELQSASIDECPVIKGGWGVPLWNEANQYPQRARDLSPLEWRWEFLRRNHRYRRDYLAPPEFFKPWEKWEYFRVTYNLRAITDPRIGVLTYRKIVADWRPSEDDELNMPPTLRDYRRFLEWEDDYWAALLDDKERLTKDNEATSNNILLVKFDLAQPLAPQLERAGRVTKERQKQWLSSHALRQRKHVEKWPLYLRALDARDAGAGYTEIAKVLLIRRSDTRQDARDTVQAAEFIRCNWRV